MLQNKCCPDLRQRVGYLTPSIHSTLPVPMHFLSLLERRQSLKSLRRDTCQCAPASCNRHNCSFYPFSDWSPGVREWESVTQGGNDPDPGREGKLVGQQGRSRGVSVTHSLTGSRCCSFFTRSAIMTTHQQDPPLTPTTLEAFDAAWVKHVLSEWFLKYVYAKN